MTKRSPIDTGRIVYWWVIWSHRRNIFWKLWIFCMFQGWEMCRAGYEFTLVEDLFTFHRGDFFHDDFIFFNIHDLGKRVNDPERREENHKIQLMNRLKWVSFLPFFTMIWDCIKEKARECVITDTSERLPASIVEWTKNTLTRRDHVRPFSGGSCGFSRRNNAFLPITNIICIFTMLKRHALT